MLLEDECSVGDLETDFRVRQPSLSQQLGELRESGVVEARREAKQVFYRISDQRAVALLATLREISGANVSPRLPHRCCERRWLGSGSRRLPCWSESNRHEEGLMLSCLPLLAACPIDCSNALPVAFGLKGARP